MGACARGAAGRSNGGLSNYTPLRSPRKSSLRVIRRIGICRIALIFYRAFTDTGSLFANFFPLFR
jgi:hypothetical protein